MNPSRKIKTVNIFLATSRGRSGLRTSCIRPLALRLEHAFSTLDPQEPERWSLMPYKEFWGYLRWTAEQGGISMAEAFLLTLETDVDPTRQPPHPFLSPSE